MPPSDNPNSLPPKVAAPTTEPGTQKAMPKHRHLQYGQIRYTLGAEIARGGYSIVYKAQDVFQNQMVIKEYNHKGSAGMWESEVQNHFALKHPRIVFMHGAFELEGNFYLALEFGGMAIGRIALGDVNERRMITLLTARGVLEALHHMHRIGYVHTDINPMNVLLELTPDNKPVGIKVCDLGLTRRRENLLPGKHKAKWNPAPETVDASAFGLESPAMDVYSTAQVLLQILIGEELQKFTEEEICAGAPRAAALALKDPLGDALAVGLEPNSRKRISAIAFWELVQKVGATVMKSGR